MEMSQDYPPPNVDRDRYFMALALQLARQAAEAGEVPVGAVLVQGDSLLAEGWNQPIASHDATAHAEIQALRAAGQQLKNYRLPDTTLYVTLEPCVMCLGAIIHARVARLVYGARDPKAGAVAGRLSLLQGNHFNHQVEVLGGVAAEESAELLREFFRQRR